MQKAEEQAEQDAGLVKTLAKKAKKVLKSNPNVVIARATHLNKDGSISTREYEAPRKKERPAPAVPVYHTKDYQVGVDVQGEPLMFTKTFGPYTGFNRATRRFANRTLMRELRRKAKRQGWKKTISDLKMARSIQDDGAITSLD